MAGKSWLVALVLVTTNTAQETVSRQLKRARRQARVEQRMSFDLERLQVKF
jgi:hypothetical protein